MSSQIKIILIIIIFGLGVFWYVKKGVNISSQKVQQNRSEFAYQSQGLKTNTAKASVPLNLILDGGPGKDGIPAITNPKFTRVKEANSAIKDNVDGIVVSTGGAVKFYPYNIVVWHEVVDDVVGGKPLVITFCPLCGSAIVFDTANKFGVSGKLYESNLLMYDKKTESLWSQSIGTAIVGDRTGEKLTVYPSQVLSFKTFKQKWPNGEVLSTDTGYSRDYSFYPYGDYNNTEDIFFPISVKDNRFPAKEIMYVVNTYGHSVAFPAKQLSVNTVSVDVNGNKVTGYIVAGEIVVKDASGKIVPGYHEMWFSWATHHQKDGIVYNKAKKL